MENLEDIENRLEEMADEIENAVDRAMADLKSIYGDSWDDSTHEEMQMAVRGTLESFVV